MELSFAKYHPHPGMLLQPAGRLPGWHLQRRELSLMCSRRASPQEVSTGKGHGQWEKFPMAIHRLVCEAWNGPCPSAGMHCCHNNGNPADNRAENLRWDTCGGNHADKVFHGTDPAGERNPRAKLSWDDVRKIRSEFSGKHGEIAELADRYGLSHSAMFSVVDGANWKDGYTSSREKKKKTNHGAGCGN